MQVKKTTQERVYPATPSPGGVLELSNNDQIMPRIYVSLLLFFNDKPAQETPVSLKASLAEVLALFYPCAGRFRERINGELEIVCNDEGAVLLETWVDCKYEDLLPLLDYHPDFSLLVPQLDPSAAISEIPPFLAQITHFECGHMCLGIQLHHCMCDGLSMSHFLSSWAILAKLKECADPNGEECECAALQQPHLDRSLLKANPLPSPTSHHPEYQTHMPFFPASFPTSTSKIFSFTPSHMDALMAKARLGLNHSHTHFEALAAHLWRGVIHARGLTPNQEVRLGIAVDGRRRLNPPLPKGYFGNVNFSSYTATTAGELNENPLSFVADLVKTAIAQMSDMHMRSALDWVAKQESPKLVYPSFCTPFIDLSITSWWRFPLYDLDFGWGRPSFVRIPVSVLDGFIILLPSPLGVGHVDALVGLQEDHMPRLEDYINNA